MSSTGSNEGELPWRNPRIVVVGSTGTGKTTMARHLSSLLAVPHTELDSLNWEANWTTAPTDVFRERVRNALEGDAWVVDGNYGKVRDLVWPRATALVWLDYPVRVVFWRLLLRTLRRTIRKEELWNGNRERFASQFFNRDSLFLWLLQTHWRRRREYPLILQQPEHAHLEVVHLRSQRETRVWLAVLGDAESAG